MRRARGIEEKQADMGTASNTAFMHGADAVCENGAEPQQCKQSSDF
jgi:hypothetical protein